MDVWPRIVDQFETLPDRLGGHIFLSLAALLVGTVISIPLGIWASGRPRVQHVSLVLASIVQTIPSLALLALMVFVWGTIGWIPALVALILYSVLPMLRNTITGLQSIDPAIIEAAAGVGMSQRQSLFLVRLPMAAPTIVAGVRTASVWVVGAATIAQPVGATSLGNYIFVGLQTMNWISLLFGCVFAAVLALVLDGLLHGLEVAVERRSARSGVWVAAGLVVLAVSPLVLAQLDFSSSSVARRRTGNANVSQDVKFVVGGKAFTEQYILADLMRDRLEREGLEIQVRDGMGSGTTFQALQQNEIDCYVDYTGTIWTNYMHRSEIQSPVEMLVDVATYLKAEHGIICLGPLGFSNDYAFAIKREHAQRDSIRDLHDLARHSKSLRAGTDIEFFDRPEWAAVSDTYGLEFAKKTTMDPTLMYGAIDNGQLDVVIAFNTDSRIQSSGLSVIEDPEYALPPYDAVLLVSERMAQNRAAMRALRPMIQAINSEQMRIANGMVDVDGQTVSAASDFLAEKIER